MSRIFPGSPCKREWCGQMVHRQSPGKPDLSNQVQMSDLRLSPTSSLLSPCSIPPSISKTGVRGGPARVRQGRDMAAHRRSAPAILHGRPGRGHPAAHWGKWPRRGRSSCGCGRRASVALARQPVVADGPGASTHRHGRALAVGAGERACKGGARSASDPGAFLGSQETSLWRNCRRRERCTAAMCSWCLGRTTLGLLNLMPIASIYSRTGHLLWKTASMHARSWFCATKERRAIQVICNLFCFFYSYACLFARPSS